MLDPFRPAEIYPSLSLEPMRDFDAPNLHRSEFEPNHASFLVSCRIRHEALDRLRYLYHNVVLTMLGEFEYLLITAAARLGDDAYGAAIREEIAAVTGRKCSIGALYTTIDRLETKGLLKTWMGDATPQRGGRAKRMVCVTPKGVHAAKDFYDSVIRVSRGVAWETKGVS